KSFEELIRLAEKERGVESHGLDTSNLRSAANVKLTRTGHSVSYELQKAYIRPVSGAGSGSDCLTRRADQPKNPTSQVLRGRRTARPPRPARRMTGRCEPGPRRTTGCIGPPVPRRPAARPR